MSSGSTAVMFCARLLPKHNFFRDVFAPKMHLGRDPECVIGPLACCQLPCVYDAPGAIHQAQQRSIWLVVVFSCVPGDSNAESVFAR